MVRRRNLVDADVESDGPEGWWWMGGRGVEKGVEARDEGLGGLSTEDVQRREVAEGSVEVVGGGPH